jgi:hypothetical protein
VETNKSTFPLQFPSWRGMSFACNVVWNPIRKVHLNRCFELLQPKLYPFGTFLGYEVMGSPYVQKT